MSDVASAPATLPIALVYGDADACAHLRIALAEFNADIVYDSAGTDLDRAALGSSGARVAVVNLDDVLDPNLDEVYATLESCGCRVVFNDPGSSVALEGWEHARWVRHLAAKLRDDVDVDPPRPAGAEPVDVAEAAHLSDRWLDDALGVLAADGGVPAAVPSAAEQNSPVDLGAVQIPDDDIEDDAIPIADFELADPPAATVADEADTSSAVTDVAGDDMADSLELELTEADLIVPAADEVQAQHSLGTDLDIADATARNDLEQPLNSSFSGDTAADADAAPAVPAETAASAAPPLHGERSDLDVAASAAEPAEPIGTPGLPDDDLQGDALSIDWSLLDDDGDADAGAPAAPTEEVAEGLDALLDHTQLSLEDDPAGLAPPTASATDDVVAADADAGAGAPSPSTLPPSSEWTLFDDTVETPPSEQEFTGFDIGDDDDAARKTRVPGQSVAESLANRDFGIELVDPIEYLAPEAPPRETELYTAPELMSMADALAPQQIDENIHADVVATPLPRIVVMAASIGGPDAVREFLSSLPADFPALFVLTQHMGTEFIDLMVKQLSKFSELPVRVPVSGERANVGQVLVVPNGAELVLSRKGAIEISTAAGAGDQEPTVSATLTMAATVFGADTLAIIFSGMVADVVAGTDAVVEHGGSIWAQDSASCVVSTMVDTVSETGKVEFSATPALLAQQLIEKFAKESAP